MPALTCSAMAVAPFCRASLRALPRRFCSALIACLSSASLNRRPSTVIAQRSVAYSSSGFASADGKCPRFSNTYRHAAVAGPDRRGDSPARRTPVIACDGRCIAISGSA
jgi:hypothetical protein